MLRAIWLRSRVVIGKMIIVDVSGDVGLRSRVATCDMASTGIRETVGRTSEAVTCDMASSGLSGDIGSISNAVICDMERAFASRTAARSLLTMAVDPSITRCEGVCVPSDSSVATPELALLD